MSAAIGLSNSALFLKRPRSIDKFWIHLFLFQSVELHAKHLAILTPMIYLWKFGTRIGLDSWHSGPKRFARHLIWDFLMLILILLAIDIFNRIFYLLYFDKQLLKNKPCPSTKTAFDASRKNCSVGFPHHFILWHFLRLRTCSLSRPLSCYPCWLPWLPPAFTCRKAPWWIGDGRISTASCPLHVHKGANLEGRTSNLPKRGTWWTTTSLGS